MRGGDGKAGFAVRNPGGAFIMPYAWKESAEHEESSVQVGGKFCELQKQKIDCVSLAANYDSN